MLKKGIKLFLCFCISMTMISINYTINAIEIAEDTTELQEEVSIISEDISEREEGTKTFIMSDGTRQKILYPVPVHYNENGEWKEIDNTLVDTLIEETIDETVQEVAEEIETEVEAIQGVVEDTESEVETAEEIETIENIEGTDESVEVEENNVQTEEIIENNTIEQEPLQETEEITETSNNTSINGYETKNSKFKLKFAKKIHKKNLANITLDNYKISWGLTDFDNKSSAVITTNNEGNSEERLQVFNKIYQNILYEDVFENVNLEYAFDSNMIKENIILENKGDIHSFTFNYKTKNLVLCLEESGNMVAKDASTMEVIFNMPKPFMVDANNEYCYDVSYVIEKAHNNQYVIRVDANEEWLNEEDRAYPVVIDPVISTNQNINDIDTTFITSAQPTLNHCNKLELLVGNESSEYGSCRILVKFDLPSLSRGDMVVDAQLNMALYYQGFYASSTPNMEVDAHMATSYWHVEQVTWNTKPGIESTVQDYDYVKHSDVNGNINWKTWNITNAVKRWYEGEVVNQGIVLKPKVETSDYANYGVKGAFWPERYNSSTQAYPYISISYRNNKGIEGYWDYTTAYSNYKDTIAINNYSGNPVITHEDASTHSQILPVTVSHVYNGYQAGSNVRFVGPYVGKGWRLSIQQTLKSSSEYGLSGTSLTTYPYVYTDEDGTEHYFMQNGTELVDEDGIGLKLTVNEASYVITDKAQNTLTFNSSGNLTEVKNKQGNTITIAYNESTITSIADTSGQVLTLTTGADGYLVSITDSAGRVKTFTYTNGLLSTIADSYGKTTTYVYDSDNSIIRTNFPDANAYLLEYTSLSSGKRVKKLQELNGKTVLVNRNQHNTTTITTAGVDNTISTTDDIKTDLVFDNYGRLISRSSYTGTKYLGAENFMLSEGSSNNDSNTKNNNKLLYSGYTSPSVNNIVLNHNLESSTSWYHSSSVGSATYTFSNTNEESLFGQKSFKLNVTNVGNAGRARFYQDLSTAYVKPNTTYTASAYIKTNNIVVSPGKYGGAVLLVYLNAPSMPITQDPAAADYISEYITGTTDEEINNGWRRVSVTFTTPSDLKSMRINGAVKDATGIAYFDGIQLEEGTVSNPYNMVLNSSFEIDASNWTGSQLVSTDVSSSTVKKIGSKSFKMTAGTTRQKSLYQTISVNGFEKDSYVFSMWVYGKGTSKNSIEMKPTVTYSDGSSVVKDSLICNPNIVGWQYKSISFDLDDGTSSVKTPVSIKIELKSNNQANDIYFDGIQLIKRDVSIYKYDADGNMISDGNKTYTYNQNKINTITDSFGMIYTYTYDANGNVCEIENNMNDILHYYQYDSFGRPTSVRIENSNLKIYTANEYTEDENFYTTKYFDENGVETSTSVNKTKGYISSSINENGDKYQYTYNNKDLLEKIDFIDSSENVILHTLQYTYDANERMQSLSNGQTTYSYGYDNFGNLTSIKIGEESLLAIEYNANNGSINKETLSGTKNISYVYDEFGNICQKKDGTNITAKYVYDYEGTLLNMFDYETNIEVKLDYDFDGNVIAINYYTCGLEEDVHKLMDYWLYGVEYGYDNEGKIIKNTVHVDGQSFEHSYEYRTDGLITNYSIDDQKNIFYSYDSLSRLSGKTINTEDEIVITYTYKDSNRGDTYTTGVLGRETHGNHSSTYYYNSDGNLDTYARGYTTSLYGSVPTGGETFYYTYDDQSRLKTVTDTISDTQTHYTYNKSGDILSKEYRNFSGEQLLDTVVYTYGNSIWGNQLTSYDGKSITYDSVGNPLTYLDYTMTWDGKELSTVSDGDYTYHYVYNSDGLRIAKNVENTATNTFEYYNMIYIDGKLVKETCENGTLYYTYDNFGNLIKIKHISTSNVENNYIVFTNSGGDVDSIYSDTGEFLAGYVYGPWGNVIKIEDSIGGFITDETHIAYINPIRYKGYHYDHETGFYYLQSRYYDPNTHRFINPDDISTTLQDITSFDNKNLYAYCDNNPLIREDEDGDLWGFTLAKIGASVAVSVIASLLSAEFGGTMDEYGLDNLMTAVAIGILGGGELDLMVRGFATGFLSYKLAVYENKGEREALLEGVSSGLGEFIAANYGKLANSAEYAIKNKFIKYIKSYIDYTIEVDISTQVSAGVKKLDSQVPTYSYISQKINPYDNIGISTYNNKINYSSQKSGISGRPSTMFG